MAQIFSRSANAFAKASIFVALFLAAAGGFALSAFHRAGGVLAALSLGVAFAGALRPAILDELFIGLSVCIPLVALLSARWGPTASG